MLSPADRSRIEKLVGMLASSFENERATAAGFLAKMASERKLSLPELLGLAQAPAAPEPPPAPQPPSSRLWDENVELLDRLAAAVNFTNVLSQWEQEFAGDVSRHYVRASQLSERQRAVAEKIVIKAKRAALSGAESTWDDVA
jgi:hypothetical protein